MERHKRKVIEGAGSAAKNALRDRSAGPGHDACRVSRPILDSVLETNEPGSLRGSERAGMVHKAYRHRRLIVACHPEGEGDRCPPAELICAMSDRGLLPRFRRAFFTPLPTITRRVFRHDTSAALFIDLTEAGMADGWKMVTAIINLFGRIGEIGWLEYDGWMILPFLSAVEIYRADGFKTAMKATDIRNPSVGQARRLLERQKY